MQHPSHESSAILAGKHLIYAQLSVRLRERAEWLLHPERSGAPLGLCRKARHEAFDAGNEALRSRRRFGKRRHGNAEGDVVRLLEGNLLHPPLPLPADETLVEAHAEACFDHVVGREAIARLVAVLEVELLLADEAILVRIMVG